MPPVSDILKDLYPRIDAAVDRAIVRYPITCKKGCSACCNLYAIITIADAINIAEYISQWADWQLWIPKLTTVAKKMTAPGITNKEWCKLNIPCIFLENNLCKIYPVRPAECRYHFVTSDPKLCSLEEIQIVRYVNLKAAEKEIWELSAVIHKEHPNRFGPMSGGPIPFMVMHALHHAVIGSRKKRIIEKMMEGLPSMREWTYNQLGK